MLHPGIFGRKMILRDLIVQEKSPKQMKNPHPVLAVHKSEELLFNLPRKQIFGVQSIFPLLDPVCCLTYKLDEVQTGYFFCHYR